MTTRTEHTYYLTPTDHPLITVHDGPNQGRVSFHHSDGLNGAFCVQMTTAQVNAVRVLLDALESLKQAELAWNQQHLVAVTQSAEVGF